MLLKVAHCGKSQIFVQIFLKSIFASEASNRRRPRSARPPAFLGFFNENCNFAAVCSKADMAQGDERRPIDFPA